MEYRSSAEKAELQGEIDDLQAHLAQQVEMQEQLRSQYEEQIQDLEINLYAATVQIANLSQTLQDARENYFSDLESSRAAIEAEDEAPSNGN